MKALFLAIFAASALAAAEPPQTRDPAEHLIKVAHDADTITIEYHTSAGTEVVTFADAFWIERLSAALAFSSYEPQSHCLCVSYPKIRFTRRNETLGTISVHHGERLRLYAGTLSGDFLVGARIGKAIIDLANERRAASSPAPGTPDGRGLP